MAGAFKAAAVCSIRCADAAHAVCQRQGNKWWARSRFGTANEQEIAERVAGKRAGAGQ